MSFTQIIYPLIFIFVLYFIYMNFKNNRKYKKENMEILFHLNEDDKIRRLISSILVVFILAITGLFVIGIINTKEYKAESLLTTVVLPILMIILYIPLMKKNMVSTLGIHKRGALVRWEDIKGINYLKPNQKNQVKVKILYNIMGRDSSMEITFSKDDSQLEVFKNTVKEYRKSKKEKKNGK